MPGLTPVFHPDAPQTLARFSRRAGLPLTAARLHVSGDDRAALLVMLCGRTEGELARLFDRAAVHLAQTLLPNRADARILCQTLGKQLAPRVFEAARRGDLSHVFFSFGVPKRVTSCSKD